MDANTKFGYIPVSSSITQTSIEEIAGNLLSSFHDYGGERFTDEMINLPVPIFYFIVTGGTEEKVLKLWFERKKVYSNEPVILIAHAGNNSLAASMEILAKLQQDGEKGKIIYIDNNTNKDWRDDLERNVKHHQVFHQLKNTKIGLIGDPSDWLVASMPDPSVIKKVWGPQVVNVDLEELKTKIAEVRDEQIEDDHYYLITKAAAMPASATAPT